MYFVKILLATSLFVQYVQYNNMKNEYNIWKARELATPINIHSVFVEAEPL